MNTHIVPTIERAESGSLVVTSETIAEGAGVEHRAVLQMISKRTGELEQFGLVAFEMRARSTGQHGGGDVRVALLNEPQATLLMSFMKNTDQVVTFKVALVKGFYEMARQLQNAPAPAELSRSDLARMVLEAENEKLALSSKIETDAPKVDYVDTFVADEDLILISTVASQSNIREKLLRRLLVVRGWIFLETSSRWSNSQGQMVEMRRWSECASAKPHFRRVHTHKAPRFRGEVWYALKATPQGAESITRMINRAISEFGSVEDAVTELERRKAEKKELAA